MYVADKRRSRQSTLAGFFTKSTPRPTSAALPLPVAAAKPRNAVPASSSPASSTLHTPSSAIDSSPLNGMSTAYTTGSKSGLGRSRHGSPLKNAIVPDTSLSDDDLDSPPPQHASIAFPSRPRMLEEIIDNGLIDEVMKGGYMTAESPIIGVSFSH